MNGRGILVVGIVLGVWLSYGPSPTSAAAQAPSAPIGHGAFPVTVVKTLDSSKLREGDTVEVATAGSFKLPDGTLVPQGSKLTGQVTAAKARSKGDPESQLTVVFNRLDIANGKQLSVKGTVQAVFPPQEESEPQMAGKATGAAGGGFGASANVGTVTDSKPGSSMSSAAAEPSANPKSTGVQGIHGLELENGVLTSKGKNVKLGDGVRMIVHVDIFG